MAAASRGRPSASAWRIAVDDTSRPPIATSGAMVVAKPKRSPRAARSSARAAAALAEAEVGADHDMGDAQALGQHGAGKVFGRQRRQRLVERQLEQVLNAQLGQPVGAAFGVHQAKRRGVGLKHLAGVRLEGDDAQGRGPRARSITDWWPRCRPSKLPMAQEAPRAAGSSHCQS
jgi:hypothetical protein